MEYRTYADLKQEVLVEADMEAEDFIQESEIKAYFNDAVREACAHIQKLGLEDDYFASFKKYSLTNGLEELSLPTDIYAAKIRALTYATPSKTYQIHRLKGKDKYQIIQDLLRNPGGGEYLQYDLKNISPTAGFKIKLYPVSQEDTTDCITMDYIRTAVKIVNDSDLVDVPEFYSFIKAFVKWKLFDKENGPKAQETKADYEKEKLLMLETLAEMTPDYDSEIPGDYSIYEEMS